MKEGKHISIDKSDWATAMLSLISQSLAKKNHKKQSVKLYLICHVSKVFQGNAREIRNMSKEAQTWFSAPQKMKGTKEWAKERSGERKESLFFFSKTNEFWHNMKAF